MYGGVERSGAYWVLVGKPERRRPLGSHRHRWEDNIKMNIQEMGSGGGLEAWMGFIWFRIGTGGRLL